MKLIGILLILLGIVGIVMGAMMFGDIGIACIIGALSALLMIIRSGRMDRDSMPF